MPRDLADGIVIQISCQRTVIVQTHLCGHIRSDTGKFNLKNVCQINLLRSSQSFHCHGRIYIFQHKTNRTYIIFVFLSREPDLYLITIRQAILRFYAPIHSAGCIIYSCFPKILRFAAAAAIREAFRQVGCKLFPVQANIRIPGAVISLKGNLDILPDIQPLKRFQAFHLVL